MHDPLRLLLVTWLYYPYMGGIPTHTYEVARRFAAYGVDVTVLTTDTSGKLATDELVEGVRIRRVRAWPTRRDCYFAPGVYREIVRGSWDLIHCQGYQTLVPPIAMLAALKANIPYVLTFHPGGHSSQFRQVIQRIQWGINRPLWKRARCLIVTARWEEEFFRKRLRLHSQRFALIPNGGTLPKVKSQPANGADYGRLIVSVGRLERYKGHHRVIAALPKVLEECPEARLRILGSGPYEDTLRNMAGEFGVADKVEIGAIPPSDRQGMASALLQASLVTLLSDYEGHPMAVTEALALGRPVLVSDHPGLKQFADQGFARSVSLKSTPEEIAAAILDQLRRPLIPTNFELPTWDDCATALLSLYREIVQKPESTL